MPESLTRKKRPPTTARVVGFKSEWWPDLFRNGGRLQIGIPAGFKSVHPAGLNRNPHPELADLVACSRRRLRFRDIFIRARDRLTSSVIARRLRRGLLFLAAPIFYLLAERRSIRARASPAGGGIVFNERSDELGAAVAHLQAGLRGYRAKRVSSPCRSLIIENCCRHDTDGPWLMPYKSSHCRWDLCSKRTT